MTASYHCVPRGTEVALDPNQGIYTGIQGNNKIIIKKEIQNYKNIFCKVTNIKKIYNKQDFIKSYLKKPFFFFLVRNTKET